MSSLFSVTDNVAPDAALEIAVGSVSAASIGRRGAQAIATAHAVEPLPPGALVPSLTAMNTVDRAAVMTAVNRVLERVGRPRRIGLVIPDIVAKVTLVRFEKVPARASDLEQLIRWQVRKSAPFPIEEAQLSFVRGAMTPEGQEFIVSLARRQVIEEYEGLCAEAGAHAGVVDLSTFSVVNAALACGSIPAAGWLVVNVAADSASIAILRGADLIFFRSRAADVDGTVSALIHQTAVYYEDRLKGVGFVRAILAGASHAGAEAEQIRRVLEERVGIGVDMLDPRAAVTLTDRISATPAFLDTLLPLVGLLLRDQESRPMEAAS
ncbi:MAG TPA: pilus assembly protein PilM [Vicinamibacterales bacterium]|jgi:Tfp pilus assembly PilM family ATPase